MRVFGAFGRWWRRRQRNTDLEMLWPMLKEKAPSLDEAKAAFAFHAMQDPAWTTDFAHDELCAFIDNLD